MTPAVPPSTPSNTASNVTQLLVDWRNGDQAAFEQLMPVVYDELRRIAKRYMSREASHHTLQTTALVNEAYLRLVNQQDVEWQNRAHFFAISAQIMRHLLVDHARAQLRQTRRRRDSGFAQRRNRQRRR